VYLQGGITVDPKRLSERELEKLTRKLVVAIKVGPGGLEAGGVCTGSSAVAFASASAAGIGFTLKDSSTHISFHCRT
jgi:glutamate dehydrogenase/leucine dehydrogenase